MTRSGGNVEALREIAEILAAGYLRLRAQISAADNPCHQEPKETDSCTLIHLDTNGDGSDVWQQQ